MSAKQALPGPSTVASNLTWTAVFWVLTSLSAMANPVVDANPTPCITASTHFTSIQAAVNAALPGTVIFVCPGDYAEQVTIDTPLTLQGVSAANHGAAVIVPPSSAAGGLASNGGDFISALGFNRPTTVQVLVHATNVNLVDLAVDGAGAFPDCVTSPAVIGVGYDVNSSGSLKRVAVRNQAVPLPGGGYCEFGIGGAGVGIISLSASGVTVTDSSVRGFNTVGIESFGGPAVVTTTVIASVSGTYTGPCVFAYAAQAIAIQITSNTVSSCSTGLTVEGANQSVTATVNGNTIVNVGTGILLYYSGTSTVYGNTIGGAYTGISAGWLGAPNLGLTSTVLFNDISAVTVGISFSNFPFFTPPGSTATGNTISDALYGVIGITGNTVGGNRFLNVATLQE